MFQGAYEEALRATPGASATGFLRGLPAGALASCFRKDLAPVGLSVAAFLATLLRDTAAPVYTSESVHESLAPHTRVQPLLFYQTAINTYPNHTYNATQHNTAPHHITYHITHDAPSHQVRILC